MSNVSCKAVRRNATDRNWICIGISLLTFLLVEASGQSPLDNVHIAPRTELMAATEPEGASSRNMRPVIKKNVDLVLVPVTVTDPMQRLVTGLSEDNFQIFENKKRQEIKHFSSEDTPVSLGIIVDTSRSMTGKMDRVREAVKQFCDSANPQDEFFVITFSDEPLFVHAFTDSPEDIEGNLLFAIPTGRTALLDAIYLGIGKMKEAKYSRRALLVISDGGDNHSRYHEGELKSAVKEADVVIYAIGIFDRYAATEEERLGPVLLANIAETSGGRAFFLENLIEMPFLASRIGAELRTQYVLGYRPENLPHDGKWHKISVKLKLPRDLAFLRARARTGYYAAGGE